MIKNRRAQVSDHALAERHHEIIAQGTGHRENAYDAQQNAKILADETGVFRREAQVDNAAHGHRDQQCGGGSHRERDDCRRYPPLVPHGEGNERQQAPERGLGGVLVAS